MLLRRESIRRDSASLQADRTFVILVGTSSEEILLDEEAERVNDPFRDLLYAK